MAGVFFGFDSASQRSTTSRANPLDGIFSGLDSASQRPPPPPANPSAAASYSFSGPSSGPYSFGDGSAASASQGSQPPFFRAAPPAAAASGPMDRRPPFVNDSYDFTLEANIMNADGRRMGGNVVWKNTTLNERLQFLQLLADRSDLNNPHISEFLRAIRWRIERDILSITTGSPVFVFSDQVEYNRAVLCYMFPDEADNIHANWMTSPVKKRKEFLLTKQNSIYGDAVRHMLGNLGNNGSAASSNMNEDNAPNATASVRKEYDPRASRYPSVNPKFSTNNVRGNSGKASNASKASNESNAANLESALSRRTGPYKSPYASSSSASSSSASSSSASSAPRASAAATKAAANAAANRAAAAKARARMEDLARQDAAQRAPAANTANILAAYATVKASGYRLNDMRTFLERFDPSGDWNNLFRVDARGSLIDKGELKRSLMMLHPDKHPNNSPKYAELFKTALNFRKTLGGTRRRTRHTKNKTGRKRRTHRR